MKMIILSLFRFIVRVVYFFYPLGGKDGTGGASPHSFMKRLVVLMPRREFGWMGIGLERPIPIYS